jgi:hypothetical protein
VGLRLVRPLAFEQDITLLDVEQAEQPAAAPGVRDA